MFFTRVAVDISSMSMKFSPVHLRATRAGRYTIEIARLMGFDEIIGESKPGPILIVPMQEREARTMSS